MKGDQLKIQLHTFNSTLCHTLFENLRFPDTAVYFQLLCLRGIQIHRLVFALAHTQTHAGTHTQRMSGWCHTLLRQTNIFNRAENRPVNNWNTCTMKQKQTEGQQGITTTNK